MYIHHDNTSNGVTAESFIASPPGAIGWAIGQKAPQCQKLQAAGRTITMPATAAPLSPSSDDEGDVAGATDAGMVTDSEVGSVTAIANSVKCVTATCV